MWCLGARVQTNVVQTINIMVHAITDNRNMHKKGKPTTAKPPRPSHNAVVSPPSVIFSFYHILGSGYAESA